MSPKSFIETHLPKKRPIRAFFALSGKEKPHRNCIYFGGITWWGWRGSNPRPLRCERSALTNWATSPRKRYFTVSGSKWQALFRCFAQVGLDCFEGIGFVLLVCGVVAPVKMNSVGSVDTLSALTLRNRPAIPSSRRFDRYRAANNTRGSRRCRHPHSSR